MLPSADSVCILATKGDNRTAELYEGALRRANVSSFWLTAEEVMAQIRHVTGASLLALYEARVPTTAVELADISFDEGAAIARVRGVVQVAGDKQHYFDQIRQLFAQHGMATLNSADANAVSGDKWLTHQKFELFDIPRTEKALCNNASSALGAASTFGYPVVAKSRFGFGGTEVRLAGDDHSLSVAYDELATVSESSVVVEPFVECGGRDRRLIVVEGEVVGAYDRQGPPGEFRSNVTIGGVGTVVDVRDDECILALRVFEATGLDVMGVDIGRPSTAHRNLDAGKAFVFETNASPGIIGLLHFGGENVSDQVISSFLRKTIWN